LNENINEVEKILSSSISQVILNFLLCNLENVKNHDIYIQKVINSINTKFHKRIFKVNMSQETSSYKIGNKIQREVIDIISIYFDNN
jgi:hypothetical protein